MRRLLSRKPAVLVSLLATLLLAAGCGSKKDDTKAPPLPKPPSAKAIKAADAQVLKSGGTVYGTFQRYLAQPLKDGRFAQGAAGREKAFKDASTATLYAVQQLGQMKAGALVDDKLSQVVVKIDNLVPRLGSLLARLRGGTASASDVNAAAGALEGIVSAARTAGADIPLDKVPAVPGVS